MVNTNYRRVDRFVEFVFRGMSYNVAYLEAGYSKNSSPATVVRAAKRLMKRPYVVQRLAELRKRADDALIMDVTERKIRLSEIARANLTDFVDGNGSINLKASGALAEVILEEWKNEDKEGTVVSREKRIKLRDPVPAIQELNKMEGVGNRSEAPPVSVTVNTQVNQINSVNQELDGDTLASVARVLGEVGAIRLGAAQSSQNTPDEVHPAPADTEATGIPVPDKP